MFEFQCSAGWSPYGLVSVKVLASAVLARYLLGGEEIISSGAA